MKVEDFLRLAEFLTGTEIKAQQQINQASLASVLVNDNHPVDCSQFNELLLLVHKDRVEGPFFDYFFGENCTLRDLGRGVEKFQKAAMLRYGNSVFAYRKLSRIKDKDPFLTELGEAAREPAKEFGRFKSRKKKLLEIEKIDRELTPYVGYLSAGQIRAELVRCDLLRKALEEVSVKDNWEKYLEHVKSLAKTEEHDALLEIIRNYKSSSSSPDLLGFDTFLASSLESLSEMDTKVQEVRQTATRNQDTYLTWDHMDVYFATSMRKAWEYMDLFDFIEELMSRPGIEELDIRYFDPTQSYTDNRVNKGLVEALMLKRARCTVYSVQDTDTLGKDSELACTLAQGKPVIAFIPDASVEERAISLVEEGPATILERLRFILYADEDLTRRLTGTQYEFLSSVQDRLDEFNSKRIWLSLSDEGAEQDLRRGMRKDLEELCQIIACSEKAVYDKRARTLRESHPLALQVNLGTGVANGVLVVRTVADCAALLRRILLNDTEFDLEEKDGMWYLRERISGCIYRVVTNDRKIGNSFWNFYLR